MPTSFENTDDPGPGRVVEFVRFMNRSIALLSKSSGPELWPLCIYPGKVGQQGRADMCHHRKDGHEAARRRCVVGRLWVENCRERSWRPSGAEGVPNAGAADVGGADAGLAPLQ